MKEEEIIKIIKDICCYSTLSFETNEKCIQAIQGLLDLYNKEKEKNKLLIEGKFREVAGKNSYIKDNYISKDKIIEKINYLLKRYDSEEDYCSYEVIIKILQSLLEEE